jgi:esterase
MTGAVALAAVELGAGPPLAILHGLFGSSRNWRAIAQALAARHRVLAFDARNHGASPWAATMSYEAMAADLGAALAARGIAHATLLGHSMGGKTAMTSALTRGDTVERLIVVDIAPVVYPQHHLGLVRAMQALDLGAVTRRGDADRALAAAVPDPAERAFLLQNLVFDDGRPRWRLNLAAIDREMPRLVGVPEVAPGTVYSGPALVIAGACSPYVRPEHEAAIGALFPGAAIARIAGAGHWVHAEQPEAFLKAVEAFLG